MPVERDDLATRIIGHNVKALQWYDDDRVLRQEVYLTDANILNIGDYPPTGGGAAAGAGSSDPSYLTLGAHDDLDNERVFSSGNGLSASDGGAGGTYAVTVSLGTGLTFSGNDVVLDWSDTPTTIEPDDAAAAGTSVYAAKGDHTHAIVAAVAGTIQPDDSAAEGSATSFARSDHAHAIVAAAPAADSVNVAASAEGNATSFARSNHTHNLDEGITPTWEGEHTFNAGIAIGGSNNELRFYEGVNYVGFEAPALTSDQIWCLPIGDGDTYDFLVTDGSGNLSWMSLDGTPKTSFTINTGASDVDVQLRMERTTGGPAVFTWNGDIMQLDEPFKASVLIVNEILADAPANTWAGQLWLEP